HRAYGLNGQRPVIQSSAPCGSAPPATILRQIAYRFLTGTCYNPASSNSKARQDVAVILFVEDAVDLSRVVVRELESAGYDVLHTASGETAIHLHREHQP